jgi:hypothetical protein
MTITARLANDLQVLKATKMILKSASCSIEEGAKSGEIGANGVNNLDLAQQFIELAYRSLERVNEIVESHVYPEFEIDDDPEPHGARDTFVPKPRGPVTQEQELERLRQKEEDSMPDEDYNAMQD